MSFQRHKFLKNQGPPVKFPAYEPETPFISLEEFNKQLNPENLKGNYPKISTTQNNTSIGAVSTTSNR